MHSSRMRTARSSSRLPGGVCLSACWDTTPPPGVGLETPQARPLNFPPGCGPEDLQCILGYHPPTPTPCGQNS